LLPSLAILFVFQLIGEALALGLNLPVPGPVAGFICLAILLAALPRLRHGIAPTTDGLLRHLSVLFVPASVGVMQQAGRLRAEAVAIGVAVLVSTLLTLAVTALTFQFVARRLGMEDR
jgi:holin-like protein